MPRGWVVKYTDDSVITEWEFQKPFSQLPSQNDIKAVAIVWENRHWVIPDKKHYFAQKSESIICGVGGGFLGGPQIESRSIGYWDSELNTRVKYTVDEHTGEMRGPYEDRR
jgi:hypothetical protein